MKKMILLLAVVAAVVGLAIYKMVSKFGDKDKIPPPVTQTPAATPRPVTPPENKTQTPYVPAMASVYVAEEFRGCDTEDVPKWIRTARSLYYVGEASIYGMVEAIRWPDRTRAFAVVKLLNGGRTDFLICEDRVFIENTLQESENGALSDAGTDSKKTKE